MIKMIVQEICSKHGIKKVHLYFCFLRIDYKGVAVQIFCWGYSHRGKNILVLVQITVSSYF